jgi:2-polyprenyl-6-methoxyphenol hydroxylase-like FAD-dependent oxidoreductase
VPTAESGVVIVGAGPTGLLLASELALAGVPCQVLERRDSPRADSRAICLHARSMEALDQRGQATAFVDAGLAVPGFPLGPRGAKINFGVLDSDFPYMLDMPQSQIERLLLARALELGAEVRWSATVTALSQDDDGATVALADGTQARAAFVVGCDGVHSFVRGAAAIPFPGVDNPGSVVLADLRLDGLPMDAAYGDLSRDGMLLVFPFRDGTCRVVLYDYSRAQVPVTEPVDLAEVISSLRRVTGQDFGPHDLYWSRRYRSESRQAPRYRSGRVLLAGDAAHAHSPAGAQGMNTGLQDAVNLGWKLAATVHGWGPGWLLDSYHDERHPVGADVLALTGRQFRLNTARSPAMRAVRWGVHHLFVPLPPVQSRLARDYSGISIAYAPRPAPARDPAGPGTSGPAGAAAAPQRPPAIGSQSETGAPAAPAPHPLTGTRLPPGTLTLAGGGTSRLYELFRDGRFVLLERSAADGPDTLPDRIRTVRYTRCQPSRLPPAVLVRPDGYIAWASGEPDPAVRAKAADAAVHLWCASHLVRPE